MRARSCADVRADLSAYLDGDLEPGLADATRDHLSGCDACRSELELLRLTVRTLRRLPDLPPPAAILTGVRARLRPEPWHRRLLAGRQWQLGAPIGALATVLVIVGIALFQSRYPGIERTASRDALPLSPLPAKQAAPAPAAPPPAAGRVAGADRRAASPPAPARKDVGAKGDPEAAPLPDGSTQAGGTGGPASSSAVDADARERQPGGAPPPATAPAPSEPAGAVAPPGRVALEPNVEVAQPARQEPPAATLQDSFRESTLASAESAAAPRAAAPAPAPAAEKERSPRDLPSPKSIEAPLSPDLGTDAVRAQGQAAGTSPAPEAMKKKAAAAARKPDSGAGMGYARLEDDKAPAAPGIRVVCLLSAGGDTAEDIEELLRREGAVGVAVELLELQEIREAFTPYRGRPGLLHEPSRGWVLTASLPPHARDRLLAALTSRSGLRILERPAAPTTPEPPAITLELRVTLLR